ncbi:hypothetical protein BDN72DRAFT_848005 [Pluteus cervinus]|uniref:Uncharacterized protein n=1 Tax=Pluteus cervinus TaxID=181527 RepID=A0ACD3AC10_9AGAR|nr:hypothetical protein BDN72DRAFT_848005 [Pluteus cervinus]
MLFTLSGSHPWNSEYKTEDGRVTYKVDMPKKLCGKRATISRCIGEILPKSQSQTDSVVSNGSSLDSVGDYAQNDPFDLENKLAHMAVVEFNVRSPSRILHGGVEVETKSYLRRPGSGWKTRRQRIFTGPDEREYKWVMGPVEPTLFLNDESATVVAKYHKKYNLPWKKQPATLEIMPMGEGIMDTIVTTLVFIELVRLAEG